MRLILLVGLQGSGKSTLCKQFEAGGYFRISQDDMGRYKHRDIFRQAIQDGRPVVVDRCNHVAEQRKRYLEPAKARGYHTTIIWLNVPFEVCEDRILVDHKHKFKPSERAIGLRVIAKEFEPPSKLEADEVYEVAGKEPEMRTV